MRCARGIIRKFSKSVEEIYDKIDSQAAAFYKEQIERGNKIELIDVKLPLEFWVNASLEDLKDIDSNDMNRKLKILSVPNDVDQMNRMSQYQQLTQIVLDINRPVLVPIDPTRYIYEKRRITRVFDNKLRNADNPLLTLDPVVPIDVFETLVDTNTINHFYRAFMQSEKDKQSLSIDDVNEDIRDSEANLFDNHRELISVNGWPLGEDESIEKARKSISSMFEELFFFEGTPYYGHDLRNLSSMILLNYTNRIFLCNPTIILFRIMLTGSMDNNDLVEVYADCAEEFIKAVKKGETDLPFEKYVSALLYEKFKVHNAFYILSMVEEVLFRTEEMPLLIADSTTSSYIRSILQEDNYDVSMRFRDFKDIQGIDDRETIYSLIKKHAVLDVIFDTKLWDEPFITHQFPYIWMDRSKIPDNIYKEYQKEYFITYRKMSLMRAKIKMQTSPFTNKGNLEIDSPTAAKRIVKNDGNGNSDDISNILNVM